VKEEAFTKSQMRPKLVKHAQLWYCFDVYFYWIHVLVECAAWICSFQRLQLVTADSESPTLCSSCRRFSQLNLAEFCLPDRCGLQYLILSLLKN